MTMKRVFAGLVLALYAPAVLAMDPPYPGDKMEGFFLHDFDTSYKISFVPGTLDKCVENAQPSYTFWNCGVAGAEVHIDTGKSVQKFVFTGLNATEMAGSPTYPAALQFYLNGKYGRTLPDGSTFETDASFNFVRKMSDPDRVEGRITVYSLGIDGGVVMKWPTTVTVK